MKRSLCSLLVLLTLSPGALAGILYVDANLNSGANDGSSWADAYQGATGLRVALAAAVAGDQVFVAQGSYRPANGANRNLSFSLVTGIELYGGFLGGESSPAERPPFGSAPSVLDGDLAGDDGGGSFGDNSYHVVRGGVADETAVLDGFTVRGGNSNGSGNDDTGGGILCLNGCRPTVRNCRFVANRSTFGGGAGYINGATPTFTDCSFEDGDGGSFGGAFDIAAAVAVRFDRCVFKGNTAARAGALEIFSSNGVVVTNCEFSGNTSTGSGGGGGLWIGGGGSTLMLSCTVVANKCTAHEVAGLRVQGATVVVVNGIFWDNEGQSGGQGSNNQVNTEADVTWSIVEGGFSGAGNLSGDPLFRDSAGGDYRLTLASPAVDAGNNGGLAGDAPLDLGRAPRRADEPSVTDSGVGRAPIIDMGAFESSIGFGDLYCEALANSTGLVSILSATGSTLIADNDVNLAVRDLPTGEFGYFLMSASPGSLPVASGTLCLGAPQVRFSAHVLNTGSGGAVDFSPDLTNLPQGQTFSAGESWYFQLWHRDGASSNFSSSLGFTWE